MLIFAGAGSGKTRVLTHRIAYVIATGRARPDEICAVTFTNKAAKEMRSRIEALLGGDVAGMWLGTFHALGVRLLRRDGEAIGVPRDFTIYDEADRLEAARRAVAAAGVDEKRWPARAIVHAISMAKNELMDSADFSASPAANSFSGGVVAQVFPLYERELSRAGALDFDDLLVRSVALLRDAPPVAEHYQRRFRHIFVDEYQDTNQAQYRLVMLLSAVRRNLTVVGDDDQCLVAGTLITMADGSRKAVEDVLPRDLVLSACGNGEFSPRRVVRVARRGASTGVGITFASGRSLTTTPEHTHFAGYRLGSTPQMWFVYLMEKYGVGFRVGTTCVYTKAQRKPIVGFRQRCIQEHADALWILATHTSEAEARAEECVVSLRYGIPQLPFVARKGRGASGLVHDQAAIDRIFASLDTVRAGGRVLGDRGLSGEHPHFRPRSRRSNRLQVVVTLAAERRGSTPVHRVGIVGDDHGAAEVLREAGFSVRPAKEGSASWRVETVFVDFGRALDTARSIADVVQGALVLNARFGKPGTSERRVSLPFIAASAVRPGMVMFTEDGGYDAVTKVEDVALATDVCDIDVEGTHNVIAGGIVTHNSIYGFRGADVRNILNFERDHPDALRVTLDQNYRSTQMILDAAHGVIRHNPDRAAKKLWTDRGSGERVRVMSVYDEQEEAQAVCAEIERLIGQEGFHLQDVAVLYRTNAQSRAFEDAMLRRGIPYRLVGGVRFYERREVKDVLAYLRLVANPRDAVSFARIVNVPRRKIGDKTVQAIERLARRRGISPFEALEHLREDDQTDITPAARLALAGFRELVDHLRDVSAALPLPELFERVVEATGYRAHIDDGTTEGADRWANVTELAGLAGEYGDVEPPEGLRRFLEGVALVSDVDTMDDNARGVTLITLHMVKGLEFGVVFMAGMEEGLLPHVRALEEGAGAIAEERRLAYVGMTRAQERLYLLHAFTRHLFGRQQPATPSRFLADLPAAALELARRPGEVGAPPRDPRAPGAVREAIRARAVAPNPVELAPQRFREGMRVRHGKYGDGTILKSTMTRAGEEVVIKFDTVGLRIFAVGDARLEVLP